MQPMNWDDVKTFLAIARSGSFARAGSVLRVNATTVGRRLTALEVALGSKLFIRTAGGLTLSEAGRALLPRTQRMEGELLAAERELRGADARIEGHVRITASDGVLDYVLLPALSTLRREHPGLILELRADVRQLDLSKREADVALRLSRPKEPALVARRIGSLKFGLFASSRYLEQRGAPRHMNDLRNHDLVAFDANIEVPQSRWLKRHLAGRSATITVNTTSAQAKACDAGLGLALLPTFVGPCYPELVQILPRLDCPTREIWCVTHQDLRANARVNCVVAWLRTVF